MERKVFLTSVGMDIYQSFRKSQILATEINSEFISPGNN
jgi:hypothetical protein